MHQPNAKLNNFWTFFTLNENFKTNIIIKMSKQIEEIVKTRRKMKRSKPVVVLNCSADGVLDRIRC